MRRLRRHKFLHLSVFFLIYSIIHVCSEHIIVSKKADNGASTMSPPGTASLPSSTTPFTSERPYTSAWTTSGPIVTTSGEPTSNATSEASVTPSEPSPTICTIPPAIQQFPRPLMGPETRKHGGLILHVIVAVYTFLGLAIVCDEYFVASLDRICEVLKMSPDVAGATFMAAGSSAPELATVVIGVFFAKDDIGVSGVIGSAVFNIMFVISVCALCSGTVCYLNWWPLVRDCFFYTLSILVMLVTIYNERISWSESLFMLMMYVVYCIALHFNRALEQWSQTLPWVPCKKVPNPNEASALVSYKTLPDDKRTNYGGGNVNLNSQDQQQQQQQQQNNYSSATNNVATTNLGATEWDPNVAWDSGDVNAGWGATNQTTAMPPAQNDGWNDYSQQGYGNEINGAELNQVTTDPQTGPPPPVPPPPAVPVQDYYKPKDPASFADKPDPLVRPEDIGWYTQASWAVVFPIHYMCRKTIPNCRLEESKNWYPVTFIMSMLWISFYSYFMVWMITIIGSTLSIPDTIMGLTFVAAGVSVPDALSSIAVIKEGYGDMAVSNAVGSNVFDILICLGLPWFIQTAIISPGSTVKVYSKGLTYSTLSLLSTVIFLLVATHINGWKLDRKLGIVLMIWYLLFITFASIYEIKFNPDPCTSEY